MYFTSGSPLLVGIHVGLTLRSHLLRVLLSLSGPNFLMGKRKSFLRWLLNGVTDEIGLTGRNLGTSTF